MANNIIRSYLVSLGFKTDKAGLSNFKNTLGGVNKEAKIASKSVLAVAAAAEYMVATFAHSMEKLYYSSQRTKSSVENIKALEYGAQQVGIEAGVATQSLESMAAAVRMNPGLRGLMNRIVGGDTSKMDQSIAMLKMVQQLGKMPHFQGAKFAGMFGMDEQTFLMMVNKAPELLAAQEKYLKLQKQSGVDMDAAAKASVEYANSLRDIKEQLTIVVSQVAVQLLPAFQTMKTSISEGLTELIKFNGEIAKGENGKYATELNAIGYAIDVLIFKYNKWATVAKEAWNIVASLGKRGGRADAAKAWQNLKDAYNSKAPDPVLVGKDAQDGSTTGSTKPKPNTAGGNMSSDGEEAYGPNGELAGFKGMQESSKRTNAQSARTKARYPNTNPKAAKDINDWINANANSTMIGTMNNARLGAGGAGTTVTLNQKTDIHVNGVSDPNAAAGQVNKAQERVAGDLCRNLKGCVN